MTREETKKAIEVMQAYVDGKEIEFCHKEANGDNKWVLFLEKTDAWDFYHHIYRIKKQPSYRPYANMQEVLKDKKIHGDMVIWKENGVAYQLCVVGDNYINPYNDDSSDYDEALKEFTWEDGSPFGVKEE